MTTGEPHCATHPEVGAVATCARCGTFACAACLAEVSACLCVACVARAARQDLPPLWERWQAAGVSVPVAFARTLVDVLTTPRRFFAQVHFGRGYGPPIGFAVTAGVLGAAVSLIAGIARAGPPLDMALQQALPRAAVRLAGIPVRLVVTPTLLALGSLLAGLRVEPLRRAFRVFAYFEAVSLPVALLTGVLAQAASFVALAVYGSIGLAAVHRCSLRQGLGAVAVVLVSVPCLFVALDLLFAAR